MKRIVNINNNFARASLFCTFPCLALLRTLIQDKDSPLLFLYFDKVFKNSTPDKFAII